MISVSWRSTPVGDLVGVVAAELGRAVADDREQVARRAARGSAAPVDAAARRPSPSVVGRLVARAGLLGAGRLDRQPVDEVVHRVVAVALDPREADAARVAAGTRR